MLRKVTLLLITIFLCQAKIVFSQNADQSDTTIEMLPMPEVRLPYNNPIEPSQSDLMTRESSLPTLNGYQKKIIQKIANIYKIQVLALESQVSDDPVSTEKYINQALSSIQKMMDDYPGVQSNRRFTELYRTVMTEYQEFYGISKPVNQEIGDIFKIRDEMFSDDNNWFNGDYFVLPDHIQENKSVVPLPINKEVKNHLAYLWIKHPDVMKRWLERAQVYIPMMKKIFKKVGVPQDLVYMSMIESGLVPYAESRARAVGMWQFIRSTGKMYGLKVNWWVDERRDPVKSTEAAAEYLKDLYKLWGNWHLAIADYNVSPYRIKRAIRLTHGKKNYWKIYHYLPRETRGYVPSYIATTIIATHPKQFGFKKNYGESSYQYDVVKIKGSVDLSILAKCAGITTDSLKNLNPELLRWATPPGNDPFALKIPAGDKSTFLANYKNVPSSKKRQMIVHMVKRGETLGHIAHHYGISVRALFAANKNLHRTIYPGQKIAIPLRKGSNSSKYTVPKLRRRSRSRYRKPPHSVRLYYTVKKGDNIGYIAEWYHTYAWKIRAWNHISNLIRVGEKLRIYVPASEKKYYERINHMSFAAKQDLAKNGSKPKVRLANSGNYIKYTVKRNDNLSDIANAFNTSIHAIKRINHLHSSRIYVGQTILIKKND
ncbi:MAG TPA: LysM peptidoglycan-binding domain-containing protein [Balneolales bacterium]|nr:LysM peptidoglycan-binding domain-containing protein [Balneolales bacterium]